MHNVASQGFKPRRRRDMHPSARSAVGRYLISPAIIAVGERILLYASPKASPHLFDQCVGNSDNQPYTTSGLAAGTHICVHYYLYLTFSDYQLHGL